MDEIRTVEADNDAAAPKTSELERLLKTAMPFKDGAEDAIRDAVAQSGGALLFQMKSSEPGTIIAAAFFSKDEDIGLVFVTANEAKRSVTVEPLERSRSPLARIAPSYVDVLAHLQPAA